MDRQLARIKLAHQHIRLLPQSQRAQVFGASKHQFLFNPVASAAQVIAWETQNQLSLPEGYRRFILEIGDGGAGPCYGIRQGFTPNPLSVSADEVRLCHLPSVFVTSETLNELPEPTDEDDMPHLRGNLMLFEIGCGAEGVLVMNGPMRGHVCLTGYSDCLSGFDSPSLFLDYYEAWQQRVLLA